MLAIYGACFLETRVFGCDYDELREEREVGIRLIGEFESSGVGVCGVGEIDDRYCSASDIDCVAVRRRVRRFPAE